MGHTSCQGEIAASSLILLMRSVRQRLTKFQWFLLFNCAAVGALYVAGGLRWRADDIIPAIIALGAVNAASLVAARKFKDWKK